MEPNKKTAAEYLLERILISDKAQDGQYQILRQNHKDNISVEVLYYQQGKRREEHYAQYFI